MARRPERKRSERGKHRRCALCKQRADKCSARACCPFEHTLDEEQYSSFKEFLIQLGLRTKTRRYSADCIDVSVAARFARECLAKGWSKLAVFSCCVMGQYGNNLQTWSLLLGARDHGEISWDAFPDKIRECRSLFAQSKGGQGLHSRNCMPGRGFDQKEEDVDHVSREVRGLQSMWSSYFAKVVSQIHGGPHFQ